MLRTNKTARQEAPAQFRQPLMQPSILKGVAAAVPPMPRQAFVPIRPNRVMIANQSDSYPRSGQWRLTKASPTPRRVWLA
jgi:hypothetical protein